MPHPDAGIQKNDQGDSKGVQLAGEPMVKGRGDIGRDNPSWDEHELERPVGSYPATSMLGDTS